MSRLFSSRRLAKTLGDRFSSSPTHPSTRRRPRSRVSTVACARPRAVLDISLRPPTLPFGGLFSSSRERFESPKHRDERKKEAPRQLATFARRRNHLLSRVRKETDEKTTRELLENARLCGHRARRERERERVTERAYLSSNSWTKCEELFFPPKKTQKKKLQQKKGAFCVQFRVLKKTKGGPFDVKRFDVLPSCRRLNSSKSSSSVDETLTGNHHHASTLGAENSDDDLLSGWSLWSKE